MAKKFKALDLFSGCGGMSLGFENQGFEIAAAIDNWKDALLTFEKNHVGAKAIQTDLGNFNPADIVKAVGRVDVVVGGPPCQGFSISGKRNPDDPRNRLYKGFVETVSKFKPKAFVLENVPNLVSMAGGKIRDLILNDFTKLGYEVKYKILLASDYGVPQNRRRVFFVGIRGKNNFEFPAAIRPDSKVTCSQAISDLPVNSVVDGSKNKTPSRSAYQAAARRNFDKIFNHQATVHEERTVSTIALVPDGGNYKDLPAHLRNTRRVHIAWTRYSCDKPSFTIDTGHRHHFHYKYNRIPTVRESARLQSFPDSFIFYGARTSQYKQVGNAVPPLMAEKVAAALKRCL